MMLVCTTYVRREEDSSSQNNRAACPSIHTRDDNEYDSSLEEETACFHGDAYPIVESLSFTARELFCFGQRSDDEVVKLKKATIFLFVLSLAKKDTARMAKKTSS